MSAIYDVVVSKIRTQREHADVLALWEKLWAAYGAGGAGAVEQVLNDLVKAPSGVAGRKPPGGRR
jgi:hypothetical protein